MNGSAKPFYAKGTTVPYMGPQVDRGVMIWDNMENIMKSVGSQTSVQQLQEMALSMNEVLENTRLMYNEAIAARDASYQRFQECENKLLQVGNILQRYVHVKEPVVASDGYTYEHDEIKKYWEECESTHSKAYSQQTKEALEKVLLPNLSLRRLVELLKKIKPPEVHPPTNRSIIAPIAGGRAMWPEDDSALQRPMDAPAQMAGPGGMNNASHGGRRFDIPKMKSHAGKPATHPCLRVYGTCNFMDDCTFANYPYEACLNYIKGKCRFGDSCKELHVDRNDTRYQNPRSNANNNNNNNGKGNHNHGEKGTEQSSQEGEKTTGSGKNASAKSEDASAEPVKETSEKKKGESSKNVEKKKE